MPNAALTDKTAPALTAPDAQTGNPVSTLSLIEVQTLNLSDAQRTAIQMMLSGATLVASANAAGVTRMTLHRWLNRDAQFQAAYNAWQHDAVVCAKTKLLALADRAVTSVAGAIEKNPWLAMQLLKQLGTLTPATPGPTDPEEISQQMEIDRFNAEAKRQEELAIASLRAGSFRSCREDK